jgi:hypothetical protein
MQPEKLCTNSFGGRERLAVRDSNNAKLSLNFKENGEWGMGGLLGTMGCNQENRNEKQ